MILINNTARNIKMNWWIMPFTVHAIHYLYLFNFPEEIWDIQPFNSSIVKQVSRREINWLKNPLFNNIYEMNEEEGGWIEQQYKM